ncbi:AfsR/SARP family transcriptional regulator [Streptomyces iconiensis]|uniref:BTAD domain-containing putative transcriptional regulator n=1 Tax=Streptomyces iconiensis TaxID=1384038 RepID=A0ABT7A6B3_9ACTN|nr:AfsR/SARP family transcriptional regulator [Streptomyces iconiensis]MDJ1136875.1 BTAD domain-containing putative transcriptional regulator [Streptomyces iconiensis]
MSVNSDLKIRILGPLEMTLNGQDITPTAPKQRQLLALLTLRRNSIVRAAELIDELWGENLPKTAMTTMQTYIYKLRAMFIAHGVGEPLHTAQTGYMLRIPDDAVDVHCFERLANEGRNLLDNGELDAGTEVLTEALGVWRGAALVDVEAGELLSAYITQMEEARFRALELSIDADLHLGRHLELISELKSLVALHPLHERFHAALMTALHLAGRRYEALEIFRKLRANLRAALGVEPGGEVQQVHRTLLDPDQSPPVPQGGPAHRWLPAAALPPAQLPFVPELVGRRAELREIVAHLGPEAERVPGAAPPVVVISGMSGVGKTGLAVAAAHGLHRHFPDGQLYAEFPTAAPAPRVAAHVLAGFIRALGGESVHLPDDPGEQANLFRSLAAGRRLLIVIDGATSAADLRPLIPADSNHAVIVTSRFRLHGFEYGHTIELRPLEPAEALELLAGIVGKRRVEAERASAVRLVELVDALPLALCGLGSRLAAQPELSLGELVRLMKSPVGRLDGLRSGDFDPLERLNAFYLSLDAREQSAMRVLCTLPTSRFTARSAARALRWGAIDAELTLERMVDCHLLTLSRDDTGQVFYSFPELTHAYARGLTASA